MTDLEKYEAVNKTNTLKELANVIRSFAVDGKIQGRSESFDAEQMAARCETIVFMPRNLTRKYGIRQQALMLS